MKTSKICKPCNRPMIVIKATTGIMGQGGAEFHGPPSEPIIFYKCEKCGELEEYVSYKIQGWEVRGGR